jgi:inward rectifier potassium channel
MARPKRVEPIRTAIRIGITRTVFGDAYHWMLTASWARLISLLVALYVCLNALFAVVYWLQPGSVENARAGSYLDCFFFSVQTMATIGYGKMAPQTVLANALVTVEALVGLLGFAMATGLLFAKFSRPTARVLFSDKTVIAMRDGVPSLMMRMANERLNQVVEAQLHLILLRREITAEGEEVRRVRDLQLVRNNTAVFFLTWTVIHPITKESPLYGLTARDLAETEAQLIASFVGLDETFAQTVHARGTWQAGAIRWGHNYVDVLSRTDDGRPIIDYRRFHETVPDAHWPTGDQPSGASTTTE